jgi:glutaredoxin
MTRSAWRAVLRSSVLGAGLAGLMACGGSPLPARLDAQPVLSSQPALAQNGGRAAARGQVPITMYMTRWCPVCTDAHRWLQEGEYTFVALDVERNALAQAQHRSLNPAGSVPTFVIGRTVVVGFAANQLRAVMQRESARQP